MSDEQLVFTVLETVLKRTVDTLNSEDVCTLVFRKVHFTEVSDGNTLEKTRWELTVFPVVLSIVWWNVFELTIVYSLEAKQNLK